jgi:hypothetical protein
MFQLSDHFGYGFFNFLIILVWMFQLSDHLDYGCFNFLYHLGYGGCFNFLDHLGYVCSKFLII